MEFFQLLFAYNTSLFCEIFPTLYCLAEIKGVSVADVWGNVRGEGV